MADTPSQDLSTRLERASDWLSPIVVKEVRQIVRSREFLISFALSLLLGLLIALLGGTSSLQGDTTAGANIFGWLMTCLTIIGIVVVPLGTFMALRNEREERTFDLIMLTTLPARRIVIGKILAQGVKLVTLFAVVAPFMATSFLLGGIDLFTILLSLGMLFIWSLWACAACLFLSSTVRSRAMSGAMLAGIGLVYLMLLMGGGSGELIYLIRFAATGGSSYYPYGRTGFWVSLFGGGRDMWWGISAAVSVCLMTMTNLVLLAENCLALEDEDRTFALRVGLFAQFLFIIAWMTLPRYLVPATTALPSSPAFAGMLALCGIQLILEAFFMATGRIEMSRRTRLRDTPTKWLGPLTVIFRPGAGRGVAYLLTKMGLLILLAAFIAPDAAAFRAAIALCGYIAFFTGLPAYAARLIAPRRVRPIHLRLAVLLTFLAALILPEIAFFVVPFPGTFDPYSLRRLFNPLITIGEWSRISETGQWMIISMGSVGLLAYVRLMMLARKANKPAAAAKMMTAHAG